tara:strand:+ start:308 stop:460 length:153 start_codon:yes stop_codon:yes gene_type:complete
MGFNSPKAAEALLKNVLLLNALLAQSKPFIELLRLEMAENSSQITSTAGE